MRTRSRFASFTTGFTCDVTRIVEGSLTAKCPGVASVSPRSILELHAVEREGCDVRRPPPRPRLAPKLYLADARGHARSEREKVRAHLPAVTRPGVAAARHDHPNPFW